MAIEKEIPERIGTQGWEQFLATKQEMLYQFDLAKIYSESHIVKVEHGKVAESTFRRWLSIFLPNKYGVTSGYIVSQNRKFVDLKLPHYDVIVYDQLNSPTLWVEENSDYSEGGKTRAIPAEYVRGVFEVKSNLTVDTSKKAIKKLLELEPLINLNGDNEPYYNGKLDQLFFTAAVFFEIQKTNEHKAKILNNLIVTSDFPFYGGVILKGEGRNINDTGQFRLLVGDNPMRSSVGKKKESLILGSPESDSLEIKGNKHIGTHLFWSPANFSSFAFDIILLLEGKFRPGFASSFYGQSWLNPKRTI
jgi:hypothetical protein